MKKMKYLLMAVLVMAFVLCAGGCDQPIQREAYTAYEITKVDIIQKGADTFQFLVSSDIAPGSAKVYITRYDKLTGQEQAISYDNVDGKFSFKTEVSYDSYFIKIVEGEKVATLPMTRPQMAPALSGSGANKVLTYNFVNGTSWSSFCDPTGKAVYKSGSTVFDENAKLVAQNINIFGVDSTTDTAASEDMPYYYVVLSAKNGIVTYVSAPIMTVDNAFQGLKAEMAEVGESQMLKVTGTFAVDGDVALELYSADTKLGRVTEIIGESVTGKAGEAFSVMLDMSSVVNGTTGAGIWYDIKLMSSTGSLYELSSAVADMGQTQKAKNVTFEFKEWNQILKLNYQYYDYDVTTVQIVDINGVPTLVIEGTMDSSLRDIKLHGDAEVKGEKKDMLWDNLSTEEGKFQFRLPLADLPDDGMPWTWFHIYVYKGNASVNSSKDDLNRGSLLSIGQTFEYNGVVYTIKAYQDTGSQLVIQADKK